MLLALAAATPWACSDDEPKDEVEVDGGVIDRGMDASVDASTPEDTTPPVITLLGDSPLELPYGSAYEDEGATAVDDVDGMVTVTSSGAVDTFSPGIYPIIYSAHDSSGNVATAQRAVNVAERTYRLDVSGFGEGGFVVLDGGDPLECNTSGDLCTQRYAATATVTVEASPGAGWSFVRWQGCDRVEGLRCTVSMDNNRVVFSTMASDTPPVLKPDVVELSASQVAAMTDYEPDSNVLFFAPNTDLSNIYVGAVLVSTSTIGPVVYFARRVVRIIGLTGATTIVRTEPVAIEDVVESGTLIASPGEAYEVDALVPNVEMDGDYSPNGPLPVIVVSGLVLYDDGTARVTVQGRIDVRFRPELAVNFSLIDGLRQFRLSSTFEVEGSLGVEIEGSVSFDRIHNLPTRPVGILVSGPLVYLVEVEPFIRVRGGVGASIEPRVRFRNASTLGIQWSRNSGWTNLSGFNLGGDVQLTDTVEAALTVEAGGGLRPTFKVYGVLGPYLRAGVYGVGKVITSTEEACPFSLTASVKAETSAGGELDLFSYYFAVETNPLFVQLELFQIPLVCDVEDPTAPSNVVAEPVSASEIQVSWDPATDDYGIVKYEVWRRDTNGGRPRWVADVDGLTYLDTGLESEHQFCYSVRAVDAKDHRSPIPLELACASTLPPEDTEPPTTPVLVRAEAHSTTAIELSWNPSTDNEGVAGYVVHDVTANPFSLTGTTALSVTIPRLAPETEYCFAVSAFDERGNASTLSNTLCAETLDLSQARWRAYVACVGRPWQVQWSLDFDESALSRFEVAGAGTDYPGTPLTYVFLGTHNRSTSEISSDIYWSFVGQTQQRQDSFSANLSSGDSGVVVMNQVQVTGCEAQIRIVRSDLPQPSASRALVRDGGPSLSGH